MALPSLLVPLNLYLVLIMLFTPATAPAVFAWSASTILDAAADLLEPSDLSLHDKSDPLLESIRQHEVGKRKDAFMDQGKVVGQNTIDEKFLVPMLTSFVGDNNQVMEYMAAVLVARATQRTLCLTPFFNGPLKHTRHLLEAGGLSMEERFDMELLGKFVKVSSLERCLQECNKQINGFWRLRSSSSSLGKDWTWDPSTVKTHELAWSFVNWTSMDHIKQALEAFSEERCVALGGLFPGFRWRGAYLATSLFMRPSQSVLKAATALQEMAIGLNQSFIAVHWRFEESICRGHELGLCFLRCGDGAVIDSGLHPTARGWAMEVLRKQRCPQNIRGVIVTKADIVAAIQSKANKEKVGTVYLATDGWMRGSKERALVKEVVEELRKSGLAVVGLWKMEELPNFSDGEDGRNYGLSELLMRSSGHVISEVEQEVCLRARAFMGSGESTWSLAVFRARLAARRRRELLSISAGISAAENDETAAAERQKLVNIIIIERLLGDSHAAGLQCRYQALFNQAKLKGPAAPEERYEDEAPDSWLDIEACETRLLARQGGGACKLAACLSS